MGLDPIVEGLYEDLISREWNSSIASASNNKEERFSIVEEIRNPGYAVPEIAASAFLDHLLPPLQPDISVKDVLKTLKKDGLLASKGRRKHSRTSPRHSRKKMAINTLAYLAEIFDKATSAASRSTPCLEQTIEMLMLPKRQQNSDGAVTRSSACFALKNAVGVRSSTKRNGPTSLSWFDIALTAEFSKTNCDTSSKSVSNIFLVCIAFRSHPVCRMPTGFYTTFSVSWLVIHAEGWHSVSQSRTQACVCGSALDQPQL